MPDWLIAIILGLIEGVSEFLPVSSTGHLLLAEHWLPRQTDLFNVLIQVGAVAAVLMVFAGRAFELARNWREPKNQQYLLKLAGAFLITAVGGLALKKAGLRLPESPQPVIWATLIGGVFILGIEFYRRGQPDREITWSIAVLIGLAQLAAAAFPGLSRSGATIMVAIAAGAARREATEFSFLLSIPTLGAAAALEFLDAGRSAETQNWAALAIGSVTALVTALFTVKWLLRYVQSHSFAPFGWYRIALALVLFAIV